MKFFNKRRGRSGSSTRSLVGFLDGSTSDGICISGYTTLNNNPEVVTAVETIARLVASMSVHLMVNTEHGDKRLKNRDSRVVDIEPNEYMTRKTFLEWVVKTMLLDGSGNTIVLPVTEGGHIKSLMPVPPQDVAIVSDRGYTYSVNIGGVNYAPNELLHFVHNPSTQMPYKGTGYHVILNDVITNLKQAQATENGFMQSQWKPSLIIKVDGLVDEFTTKEGREKILTDYAESGGAGMPWLIPAEQFDVKEIKPLSLKDLALSDNVTLDKRTVAAILGVPAFVLGIGKYDQAQWTNFINATIMPIAQGIQQELTRKLLIDEHQYFKFSPRSLYNYEMKTIADIATQLRATGLMTGNEARGWLDLAPCDGLDNLVMLENYIPADKLGDQKKLEGDDREDDRRTEEES